MDGLLIFLGTLTATAVYIISSVLAVRTVERANKALSEKIECSDWPLPESETSPKKCLPPSLYLRRGEILDEDSKTSRVLLKAIQECDEDGPCLK